LLEYSRSAVDVDFDDRVTLKVKTADGTVHEFKRDFALFYSKDEAKKLGELFKKEKEPIRFFMTVKGKYGKGSTYKFSISPEGFAKLYDEL
jgi:hypothetical protein